MKINNVSITEEILADILHVCSRYQGKEVDKCASIEKWATGALSTKACEIAMVKIMEEFKEKERKWLAQFKKGDIWKPKEWKCKKLFQIYCEYKPEEDPACDNCIHCHEPYERK